MNEQIFLNLKNCLNPDDKTRKEAENFIENAKIFKLQDLPNNLFLIFSTSSNNIDKNIQNMASIIYKNILCEENIWINLSSSLKNKIGEDLYNIIEKSKDENKIKNACIILANILFKECQNNDIKNLKLIIKKIQNVQNNSNNNKLVISYLFTIKIFFDNFEEQKLLAIDIINSLQMIIIPLIKNYKNENDNFLEEKKLELALDIYILIIPFMKFSFNLDPDYVFKPVLDLMQKLNLDRNIYMKNLLVINEAINYYHRYIINHIKIICTTLFDSLNKIIEKKVAQKHNDNNNIIIINDNLSNIVLFYLDIICLLCDKELEDKTSLTTMFQNNASEEYLPSLVSLLDKFPEFNIENESWNISKAICYIISFIVNISSQDEILLKLLNYFSKNFNSILLSKKINAILILSCILDSKDSIIIKDFLQDDIINIIQRIDDKDKIYSYIISWLLGKISELLPTLFPREDLEKIIPKFINVINNKTENNNQNQINSPNYTNEVRINICIALGNLIKFYGDENTNKINNEFNIYYKYIINDFIEASFKEENIITGLSFYLLRIIMNVIQYSSKDLQASLEIIFSNILQKFEQINILIKNNKNKIQKIYLEKLYKLQENLCLILNQIFNKIIRKINISLCVQLYNSIINSFFIRDNKAFESGMLCLLNLVILLFNDDILMNNKLDVEIFYKLISAILINEEDGDNLKKIAILCLLNLIKINSNTLLKYINDIYDILKNISDNEKKLDEEFKKLLDKSIANIEQSKVYIK